MPIELSEELVDNARDGKADALSTVIIKCYPPLCRIAIAVAGDAKRGLDLVQGLVRGSLVACENWNEPTAPWRWFLHHAILNLRRLPPSPGPDPLVQYSADKEVPFVAFVSALRKLPPQQQEAFILRQGEKMSERELAVAMDCSVTAAVNHLLAAQDTLKLVAAEGIDQRMAEFRTAYDNLSPDPEAVKQYVMSRVQSRTTKKRTRGVFKLIVWVIALAAVAYGLYQAFQYMSA
jgi:DNA-directed RNA polymerase specialized sigma24 family protein